ncbi:MAG: TolC family protein [Rhodocyclaceae bacterium]|nr:TolC family protein [Rhodocyclaceae bacterium]MBX3670694.1 TolC family protein [Rhodocyclaceae bacterium]
MRHTQRATWIAGLLLPLFCALNAPAATLGEAVSAALAHHPDLAAAEAQREAADASVSAARSAYWPRLGATYERARAKNELSGVADAQPTRQADVYLRWNVWSGLGDHYSVAAASHDLDAARGQVEGTRERAALQVVRIYLDILNLNQQVSETENLLHDLSSLRALVAVRVENGRSPQADLLQADSRLLQAQGQLLSLRAQLAGRRASFQRLTGLAPQNLLSPEFDGSTAQRPLDELIAAARDNNADLRAAREQAESAASRVGVARRELMPEVNVEARKNVQRDGPIQLQSGLERETLVQVTYEVALGGGGLHRVSAARARELGARANAEALELRLSMSVGEQVEQLRGQRALSVELHKQWAKLGETYRAFVMQFDAGRRTLLDALDLRQEQHNIGMRVTDNMTDIAYGSAQLEQMLGRLLKVLGIRDI